MRRVVLQILVVGLGGFFGSISRYLLCQGTLRLAGPWAGPLGTLGVNLLGCFLIGLVAGYLDLRETLRPEYRLFLVVGLLGGFTTFSAFGQDNLSLIRDGHLFLAGGNAVVQVGFGLLAAWAGHGVLALVGR